MGLRYKLAFWPAYCNASWENNILFISKNSTRNSSAGLNLVGIPDGMQVLNQSWIIGKIPYVSTFFSVNWKFFSSCSFFVLHFYCCSNQYRILIWNMYSNKMSLNFPVFKILVCILCLKSENSTTFNFSKIRIIHTFKIKVEYFNWFTGSCFGADFLE